jgi:CBS-domain-containing membrane protein
MRLFYFFFFLTTSPFGAFMTLLYGLGSAPASQPRNALFGQAVSISTALLLDSIDALKDHVSMKQALAVALAIAAMTKLGLTHPPAGAAALLFAGGDLSWTHLFALLIGNVVAIGMATAINNWSNKRQYPSYWGLLPPGVPNVCTRTIKTWWKKQSPPNER